MQLPFDEFAIAALVVVLVVGGMRLFYGSWPWEASKTWYCTRRAVAYVEALRGEKKRDPALGLVRDAVDTSSDSFDRSLTAALEHFATRGDTTTRGSSRCLHCTCPLLTQSGHAHELDPGQCYAASVG